MIHRSVLKHLDFKTAVKQTGNENLLVENFNKRAKIRSPETKVYLSMKSNVTPMAGSIISIGDIIFPCGYVFYESQ